MDVNALGLEEAPWPRPWLKHYQDRVQRFDSGTLLSDHMAELIRESCARHGDQPAYTVCLPNGSSATISFSQVDEYSDAVAFYLRHGLGLQIGDVVAIQAPNCLAYPVIAYGIFKAGLTMTGVNPLYTKGEANFQLKDSGAKTLFAIDLFGDRLKDSIAGTDVQKVIRVSVVDLFPKAKKAAIQAALRLQGRRPRMSVDSIPFSRVLSDGLKMKERAGGDVRRLYEETGLDDVLVYQYSGGTTGRSKGAEITQRNILTNMTQQHHWTGHLIREGQEQSILVLPLYHVYALAISGMHGMRLGNHTVLIPNPRPLSNLKAAFEQFPPTILPGINTLYQGLLREDWFLDMDHDQLKFCFSGAAPLQQATAQRWKDVTGCAIHEGYGLTEGTCVVTSSPLDETMRPGTVGIPIPGTDLRIVDEHGKDVPIGEPGEILVSGPQVMKGYLGRPDATEEAIRGGWLHTGDIGALDEDGYLRIVDRKKDMIIVSGFNVFPAELEDVIARLDGVAEVAVVGTPDKEAGERPVAFVVPDSPELTEEDVAAHCRANLTNYKRPKSIVFLDELPKSPIGKLLRRALRDRARSEAGETEAA